MEKILLELSDIEKTLNKFFLEVPEDLRSELSDLRLKKSCLSVNDLDKTECLLEIKLPNIFKQMILKYDFGDLTLGGVYFGSKENYGEYLIKANIHQIKDQKNDIYFAAWWGYGKRLTSHIMIGESDGYVILLNTETEEILAYPRTKSYKDAELVAYNFENFVRAAATIFIVLQEEVDKAILTDIPLTVGSHTNNWFWRELM